MWDSIVGSVDSLVGKFFPDKTKAAEFTKELSSLIETQLTERHKNDMASDSWLSKNIRPLCLMFVALLFLACTVLSWFGIETNANTWQILVIAFPMALGFYFSSRGVEKFIKLKK